MNLIPATFSTCGMRLQPLLAWILFASWMGLIIYGVSAFRLSDFQTKEKSGEDLRCYYAIAERIHSGEGYYEAARQELQSRGYVTGSVFNWRMPVLAILIGKLPSPEAARGILVVLSFVCLWLWVDVATKRMSILKSAFGAIPLAGFAIYSCIEIIFVMHELWAGLLIAISILANEKGRKKLSLLSGVSALFIRELSLVFAAIMFFMARQEGKRGESMAWLGGVLLFLAGLACHAWMVREFSPGSATLDLSQWLAFGGWNYVLATIQIQPFLLVAPSWCTAILAPTALVGFIAWHDTLGRRIGLTTGAYILAFLFVGKSNNAYWGLMYCNVAMLGLLYSNASLSNTFRKNLLRR